MGLLKKIFKPVSKVLDKIIPNEVKPFLPYAAAFAPYMMPGIMGIGGNTMLSRALMSGGLNIGSQLAQEGSEGDINLLSAGLGALQGAMTAPGSLSRSMHPEGFVVESGQPGAAGILEAKAAGMKPGMMKSGLEALSGGSEFLTGAAETLQSNPFSVEGLKAAAIPFAQGTADVMYAEGQRDLKDLANDVVDDMGDGYTDDAYRAAIRKSMTAYGATEEEILAAIEAAGYRSGGRVGLLRGGDPDDAPDQEDVSIFELQKGEGVPIGPQVKADKQQLLLKAFADYKAGGGTLSFKQFSALWMRENAAQGGRVGLVWGGMPRAIQAVEEKETEWITQKPEWETVKRDLNNIFQEAGGLQGDGMNAVGAYVRDNNLNYEWLLEGDEIKVKEKENIEEPVNILDSIDESNTININGLELLLNNKANGGRIGYENGELVEGEVVEEKSKGDNILIEIAKVLFRLTPPGMFIFAADEAMDMYQKLDNDDKETVQDIGKKGLRFAGLPGMAASAGMSMYDKFKENKMADGGVPSVLPKGVEADYRGGGFIPIGSKERADDVPARLSENEFVMTADAVRAAGGGNVNKGAQRMYNVMNQLEARA
jgi:hypothetical protein